MTSEYLVFVSVFQYTRSMVNHQCFPGKRINQAGFDFLLLTDLSIAQNNIFSNNSPGKMFQ